MVQEKHLALAGAVNRPGPARLYPDQEAGEGGGGELGEKRQHGGLVQPGADRQGGKGRSQGAQWHRLNNQDQTFADIAVLRPIPSKIKQPDAEIYETNKSI